MRGARRNILAFARASCNTSIVLSQGKSRAVTSANPPVARRERATAPGVFCHKNQGGAFFFAHHSLLIPPLYIFDESVTLILVVHLA